MNCIIPGGNMKIWNRAIQSLCKIGDEVYLEARKDCLQLATINMNKTAYATINFHHTFFSSYTIFDSTADVEKVNCKIHIKSMLSIFKYKGPKDTDKKIELCKIEFRSDGLKIVFKLKYKHDIMMVHSLRLMETEFAVVSYRKDTAKNQISSTAHFFTQVLANFQMSDDDMNCDVSHNKIVLRNYDSASAKVVRGIRSQVVLNLNEFNTYNVNQETNITVSFKPFRTAIHFAEVFGLNVALNFDTAGKPLVLLMKSTSFEMDFVLSSINTDGVSQSSVSMSRSPSLRRVAVEKLSEKYSDVLSEDALENINWLDNGLDEIEDDHVPRKKAKNSAACLASSLRDNNTVGVVTLQGVNTKSPESPRITKLKLVFARCINPNFDKIDLDDVLARNSDSEDNT